MTYCFIESITLEEGIDPDFLDFLTFNAGLLKTAISVDPPILGSVILLYMSSMKIENEFFVGSVAIPGPVFLVDRVFHKAGMPSAFKSSSFILCRCGPTLLILLFRGV